jgi:three-Cys-motif partner protein
LAWKRVLIVCIVNSWAFSGQSAQSNREKRILGLSLVQDHQKTPSREDEPGRRGPQSTVGSIPVAENFFDEQSEQSQVKAAIISKYFRTWAKVITGSQKSRGEKPRIAYIDLFASPGRYKDGAKSTPLLILEEAVKDEMFRNSLRTLFNDKDSENSSTLLQAIKEIPGIETLKHEPDVYTEEVGEEIVKMFEELTLVPTLFFVDPWGYKGLSLRLINSVLKDFGCECVFFFNYNRINMGLPNAAVKSHMEALFGVERAEQLRVKLEPMSSRDRELTIVEEICQALKDMGRKTDKDKPIYVLPFCFKNEKGNRTSHHLIFVSKHPLGYKIMKRVMAAESSLVEQGVASFEYNPADKNQPFLFGLFRPLDDLEGMLLEEFAGCTVSMVQIYDKHNVGRRYTDANYKEVLRKMELDDKITADPPHTARPKRKGEVTFADGVMVTFPPRAKKKK